MFGSRSRCGAGIARRAGEWLLRASGQGRGEAQVRLLRRMTSPARTGARLVALVCTAQVFVQIGAFYWPALLPQMMRHWSLSNGEAGWITSAFYGAYMLAVPVLVTLTDRIDAKRVYLFGVGCTVVAHLAFGLLAEGFWSAMARFSNGSSMTRC